MTIWVLKDPNGRTVLVDAGFYRPRFLTKGNSVADYIRPDKALERLGIKPEDVTDVVVTHSHLEGWRVACLCTRNLVLAPP